MSSTTATTAVPVRTEPETRDRLWLPGIGYAAAGAVTAFLVAAAAHAAGVSLEIAGEKIPLLGFANLAFVFSMVGVLMAAGMRRWTGAPRRTFVRTTVALTVLSFVPDLVTADIDAATRVTLMLTHVAAAAVVIPRLARRLRA